MAGTVQPTSFDRESRYFTNALRPARVRLTSVIGLRSRNDFPEPDPSVDHLVEFVDVEGTHRRYLRPARGA